MPGNDVLDSPFVIAFFAGQTANNGELIHAFGQQWKIVGKQNPIDIGLQCSRACGDIASWMRVKGLQLAGSPLQPQHNQALGW